MRSRFAEDGPLVRKGLVSIDDDQDVEAIGRLRRFGSPGSEEADVRTLLLGQSPLSELLWSDFDHLGQNREDVARLIRGAAARGARGVNVLVYGPPGTGKTEFCRVLAKRLELDLFGVGEADERGSEPSREERLAELCLAQHLVGEDSGGLLLFDEMEDILSGSTAWSPFGGLLGRSLRGSSSKVFMNRLLEETPTPILWTTNAAEDIEPHILRRMMFALEMRQPPAPVRARIWTRQLSSHGIEATPAEAESLAREFDASPGVAAGATAAASLAGGDFDLVRSGVRSLSRVLGRERPERQATTRFDPRLLEADIDLGALADRLADRRERRFSICLHGAPGTGKSAYARYLAERLDLEVKQMRASDLLGMYVGQSEKNIARAFAEARDRGGVSGVRRGGLATRGPAGSASELGGEPGERDADVDGKPSIAVRVHDQLPGEARRSGIAAIHVQGDARPPRTAVGMCGFPRLLRPRGTVRAKPIGQFDARRLRGRPTQG